MYRKLLLSLFWGCFFSVAMAAPPPPAGTDNVQKRMQDLEQFLASTKQNPKAPATQPAQGARLENAAQPALSNATPVKAPGMHDEAFVSTVDQLLPMTPEQIARLKSAFNDSQRAAALPVGTPPKPTSSSVIVDLAPQAAPPIIRLQAGYITSLVFMDSTGQPWPVAAYSLGDPTAFNIQWDKKGNTLLVQSVTFYKRTNIAVLLKDLNTPIMLTLLTGQEAVDYRVDLRVPGMGPNAMFEQASFLPGSANPDLLNVLNAVPPKNSKTLKPSRSDCQAWYVNKTLFLRTRLDVISPAWKSVMTSIDGTHAYELPPTPVILVLEHGKEKPITLTLEGWE